MRQRRHRLALLLLLALTLGLAALAVPAARLRGVLDEPLASAMQVFSIDGLAEAAALMRLLSQVEEAERAAQLEAERIAQLARDAERAELADTPAGLLTRPVATIVVRGSRIDVGGRRTGTPDHTRPTAPQGVVAGALSDTSVEVTWGEAHDDNVVVGYEVVREGTAPFTVNDTRFIDSGLRAATSYCYRVIAMDDAGNRSSETPAVCVETPDVLPPTAPGRIAASVTAPDVIALSWAESVDDVSSVSYELLDGDAVIATTTGTSWTHVAAARRQHRYSVRAVDATGNRSAATEPTVVSLGDTEPPTKPTDVKLTPVSPTQIAIEWAPASDNVEVERYEVLEDGNVVVRSGSTRATAHLVGDSQRHCLSVRAVDAAGNRSQPTAPVCEWTIEPAVWKARQETQSRPPRRR